MYVHDRVQNDGGLLGIFRFLFVFFCSRFESSHLFLQLLLCKERKLASSLPLNQLWPSLIGAACQLTGEKRLKVVALLLQVLHLSSSSR